jgi:hypothetical protein
MNEASFNNW